MMGCRLEGETVCPEIVMFISRLLCLYIIYIRNGVEFLSGQGRAWFLPRYFACGNVCEATMCSMSKFETAMPQIPSVDKQREALDAMSAHLRLRLEEMQQLQELQARGMRENKARAEAALRGEMPAAKAEDAEACSVREDVSVESVEVAGPPPPSPPDVQAAAKSALPPVKNPPPAQFASLSSKPKTQLPSVKNAVASPPSYGAGRGGFVPRPPLARPDDQGDEVKMSPFMAGAVFVIAFFIFFLLIYALSK